MPAGWTICLISSHIQILDIIPNAMICHHRTMYIAHTGIYYFSLLPQYSSHLQPKVTFQKGENMTAESGGISFLAVKLKIQQNRDFPEHAAVNARVIFAHDTAVWLSLFTG